jgi:hypothetical protein
VTVEPPTLIAQSEATVQLPSDPDQGRGN